MFSTELKFTIDVLVKWVNDVFKSRFNELDAIGKPTFLKENSIDRSNENCVILLKVSSKSTRGYNFTVQKERLFLRNIYSDELLKKSENMSDLKLYFIAFDYFLRIAVLLNKYYNKNSNVEDVDHDVIATFLDKTLNLKYNFFWNYIKTLKNLP